MGADNFPSQEDLAPATDWKRGLPDWAISLVRLYRKCRSPEPLPVSLQKLIVSYWRRT